MRAWMGNSNIRGELRGSGQWAVGSGSVSLFESSILGFPESGYLTPRYFQISA